MYNHNCTHTHTHTKLWMATIYQGIVYISISLKHIDIFVSKLNSKYLDIYRLRYTEIWHFLFLNYFVSLFYDVLFYLFTNSLTWNIMFEAELWAEKFKYSNCKSRLQLRYGCVSCLRTAYAQQHNKMNYKVFSLGFMVYINIEWFPIFIIGLTPLEKQIYI